MSGDGNLDERCMRFEVYIVSPAVICTSRDGEASLPALSRPWIGCYIAGSTLDSEGSIPNPKFNVFSKPRTWTPKWLEAASCFEPVTMRSLDDIGVPPIT